MALHIVDEFGRYYSASKRKLPKAIRDKITSLDQKDRDSINNFILDKTSDGQIFCVATKFGFEKMNWADTPLFKLWKSCGKNNQIAAVILGHIVMEVLQQSNEDWTCSKTPITKRDFEVNCFYVLENYKNVA